jgi:hypothetical protein
MDSPTTPPKTILLFFASATWRADAFATEAPSHTEPTLSARRDLLFSQLPFTLVAENNFISKNMIMQNKK